MKRKSTAATNIIPLILLLALVGIAPFISAIYNSFFHDYYGIRSPAGLSNLSYITEDKGFFLSLRITVLWAFINTIFSLFISLLIALSLYRFKHIFSYLYILILIPLLVPVFIAVPLWRAFLFGNGTRSLFTSITGIKLNILIDPIAGFGSAASVSIWFMIPVTSLVLLGGLKKVPLNTINAAKLDGAGFYETVFSILLPQLKQTIYILAVLNFIKAFKEFSVIFLMTGGGPPLLSGFTGTHIIGATTTLEILLFDTFKNTNDAGISSAFSLIMMGIVILMMAVWLVLKSTKPDNKNTRIIGLTAIVHLFFGAPFRLILFVGFLLSAKWKKLFFAFFLVELLQGLYIIITKGFLAGINLGFIFSTMSFIFLLPELKLKFRLKSLLSSLSPLWKSLEMIILAILLLSAVLLLYLLLWMSLSKIGTTYVDTFIPRFLTFSNYPKVIVDNCIFKYFLNTFIVALCTGILVPLIAFPASHYITKFGRKTSAGFLTFLQVFGIMGGIHSLIPLYMIFRGIHILNTYIPLVLVYSFHSMTFSTFIIYSFLKELPKSLEENAVLEGAGTFNYLKAVLFPLSMPVIAVSFIVSFLNAWNGFLAPLLFLNDDVKYTISLKLFSFIGNVSSANSKWNLFAASSLINIVLVSLVFFPLRKTFLFSPLSHYEEE